ncbi:MAG: hypothetical protein ABIA76_02600 [Candidatus Diapherotrites archaeon]
MNFNNFCIFAFFLVLGIFLLGCTQPLPPVDFELELAQISDSEMFYCVGESNWTEDTLHHVLYFSSKSMRWQTFARDGDWWTDTLLVKFPSYQACVSGSDTTLVCGPITESRYNGDFKARTDLIKAFNFECNKQALDESKFVFP